MVPVSSGTFSSFGSKADPHQMRWMTVDVPEGNGVDFGDLINVVGGVTATASSTRAVFAGGRTPSEISDINFINIATTGDALDFGDLLSTVSNAGAVSNGHGGL